MKEESITVLLDAARRGEQAAADDLFAAVYDELRKLARANRRRWRGNETLNTTALIHEVYIKIAGQQSLDWQNRTHFYATAAQAMRQVLINYAERARADKRGGGVAPVTVTDSNAMSTSTAEELLLLTEHLAPLEEDNPRRCRIVECRVFGGMTIKETALALGISEATVKREWQIAAAMLRRNMAETDDEDAPE
ncbi:MAG: ECF-type sigma factor [Pseudomonadota bacterium]